jgi:hypothetical protein
MPPFFFNRIEFLVGHFRAIEQKPLKIAGIRVAIIGGQDDQLHPLGGEVFR